MNYQPKVKELRNIIHTQLIPLIDNDYVYLDLPYHTNIGDTLIWEGTRQFLKKIPHRCLYATSFFNVKRKMDISADTIILLHGGGNWGDIWPSVHIFRKQVVEKYPQNKIIVFPQSVHYQDANLLDEDAAFYNRHLNVTICVRDKVSYNLLSEKFKNKILLLPDMAFCIEHFPHIADFPKSGECLYLQRGDKEKRNDSKIKIPLEAAVRDWPTMDAVLPLYRIYGYSLKLFQKVDSLLHLGLSRVFIDWYWKHILRPYNIKKGMELLKSYDEIYSTRLHAVILGILLNKKVHIVDNNYNKTTNYINTWFEKY